MPIPKRLGFVLLAAALAAPGGACGGKSKPPSDPPPLAADPAAGSAGPGSAAPTPPRAADMTDAEFDKLMNEVVGFFGALGEGVGSVSKDCKKTLVKAEPPKPEKPDPKSKKKPAPPEPTPPPQEVTECTPAQCAAMAKNIEDVLAKHEALLARTKAFGDDEAAAQRAETWMKSHGAQVQPIFQKMAEGLKPCAADEAVNEAMKKLGNAGGGG